MVASIAAVLASCALSVVGAEVGADDPVDSGAEAPAASDVTVEREAPSDATRSPDRVTQGLVVLYTFARDAGETVVRDVSGVEPALDLVFADGGLDDGDAGIVWQSGAVEVRGPGRLSSTMAATKIAEHVRTSNELTVEAWIVPRGTLGMGPARIVSMSRNTIARNFTLGMESSNADDAGFVMRLRTTTTDDNGTSNGGEVVAKSTVTLGRRTHVVFTRSADGARAMFVDGVKHDLPALVGDLSGWDSEMPLHLANEGTDDRIWLGAIELVAIYARALGPEEVQRNLLAGP